MLELAIAKSNSSVPLPWHTELWQSFNQLIDNQRLPHAIILNGLEGVGAEHLAYALAYRMLCNQVDNGIACGQCSGCITLQARSHPDFYLLQPEEKVNLLKLIRFVRCVNLWPKPLNRAAGRWRLFSRQKL